MGTSSSIDSEITRMAIINVLKTVETEELNELID